MDSPERWLWGGLKLLPDGFTVVNWEIPQSDGSGAD